VRLPRFWPLVGDCGSEERWWTSMDDERPILEV
jgi:hypothetical protein